MVSLNLGELTELLVRTGDTIGDASKTVTATAEKAGSVTSTALKFVGEHPYVTTIGVVGVGVAGVTLVGATTGAITDIKSALSDDTSKAADVYIVDNTGKIVTPDKKSTTDTAEDTGLLGWFSKSFSTGLFGTQENADSFMTQAKPWLIGGAVLAGIIVVGYTVKSFPDILPRLKRVGF